MYHYGWVERCLAGIAGKTKEGASVSSSAFHGIRDEKISQRLSESSVPPNGIWNSSMRAGRYVVFDTFTAFRDCRNRHLP
jgi:hypothetical protein